MKKTMVVLGAGPAGLTCALEGARRGLKVTLLEKNRVGERINCGEGFFDLFNLAGKPFKGVLYKVKDITISALNTYSVDCSFLNLWMLDRQEWQKALANLAAKAEVDLIENCAVQPFQVASLSRQYNWVVDATGIIGLTSRRSPGICPASRRKAGRATTLQCVLQGDFRSHKDNFKIALLEGCTGYCWLFPKSINLARVGVVNLMPSSKKINLNKELHAFMKEEGDGSFTLLEKRGGIIPITPLWTLLKRENIFLTGDAAGLASSLHGGGLDTAVASGMLVARCLAEGKPEAYPVLLRETLKPKIDLERKIYWAWEKLGLFYMDNMLKTISSSGLNSLLNKFFACKPSALLPK